MTDDMMTLRTLLEKSFDADLLRVRAVTVDLRVQRAVEELRGAAAVLRAARSCAR